MLLAEDEVALRPSLEPLATTNLVIGQVHGPKYQSLSWQAAKEKTSCDGIHLGNKAQFFLVSAAAFPWIQPFPVAFRVNSTS